MTDLMLADRKIGPFDRSAVIRPSASAGPARSARVVAVGRCSGFRPGASSITDPLLRAESPGRMLGDFMFLGVRRAGCLSPLSPRRGAGGEGPSSFRIEHRPEARRFGSGGSEARGMGMLRIPPAAAGTGYAGTEHAWNESSLSTSCV